MGTYIYLDNAATTFPKPESVYTFTDAFFRSHGVYPGRSGYDLCTESGDLVDDTRRLLTRFFGGTIADRLVFTHNATDALNLALFGMLHEGDHAIATNLEHNSVLRPCYHLALYHGVEVDYVAFDGKGFVDPDDVCALFRDNTKVVVITHASNVIGTVQRVAEIGAICRERGVSLIVDAAQTAGRVPIDIEAMNIDVLAFTGHKALMGPTGVGGLYVRYGVEIRHTRAGATGVRGAQRTHLDEYPWRLEYGTPNVAGIAGLQAGVTWIADKGVELVAARQMALLRRLRDGLRDVPGVTLYCQDDLADHVAILAFNLHGLEATQTATLLDVGHRIACRAGLHCAPLIHAQLGTDEALGAVRFSLGPFNTEADIDAAVAGVRQVALTELAHAAR